MKRLRSSLNKTSAIPDSHYWETCQSSLLKQSRNIADLLKSSPGATCIPKPPTSSAAQEGAVESKHPHKNAWVPAPQESLGTKITCTKTAVFLAVNRERVSGQGCTRLPGMRTKAFSQDEGRIIAT